MILSKEGGALYFALFIPLLDYVNERVGVTSQLKKTADPKAHDPRKLMEIAGALWDDVGLIDAYLEAHAEAMPEGHKEILRNWKKRVRGTFILERHLKKGSMLIALEDERVYQVSGITTSWEETVRFEPLPLVIRATLIPFGEVIISDGLNGKIDRKLGPSIKRGLKEIYMTAKKSKKIIKTL